LATAETGNSAATAAASAIAHCAFLGVMDLANHTHWRSFFAVMLASCGRTEKNFEPATAYGN